MIVKRLKVANVRAIEAVEFQFQPGINLIVGVNGAGKTSVLDSLRVCLSAFVKRANKLRTPVEGFVLDDIRVGTNALTVECTVRRASAEHQYVIHKPREASAQREGMAGRPREQVHDTPGKASFLGAAPEPATGEEIGGRPLAALFSTKRAVPSARTPSKRLAAGGVAAAFADAFADRELRLGELAAWMRAQEAVRSERARAGRALDAFENAVVRFLPGYANLRTDDSKRPRLLIDGDDGTVAVRQMSDGERGVLALVLDLTRRLVQANPELTDPVAEAEAVVLIDEIELHLHPSWQRQIVRKLEATFPSCQFIATTHSPQVIGEVEHDRVQIIADGEVYRPPNAFGMDSSRVLEEIMDAPPRNRKVKELLAQVSREIDSQRYKMAKGLLVELVEQLGENDPEVTRIKTLLDFMEGDD
ncbi:AAA family ATPase [Candidatus Palauibacter sp.]|uniref:AAA family ATPase n=1 Tax=Candidatus Palauibacter sp. TaxID=3101350 RepID=UPI003D0B5012